MYHVLRFVKCGIKVDFRTTDYDCCYTGPQTWPWMEMFVTLVPHRNVSNPGPNKITKLLNTVSTLLQWIFYSWSRDVSNILGCPRVRFDRLVKACALL